jgi:hypothetical protein
MPTTDDLYRFLTQGLGKIDGVRDWTANVELLTIKRGFLETPWSRDGEPELLIEVDDDASADGLVETPGSAVAAVAAVVGSEA